MAEPPRHPHVESSAGTPRWVKVFGAIALVVLVAFVVLLLLGGHGPERHSSGEAIRMTAA